MLHIANTIKANRATNPAASLWPYYENKQKINVFVMVFTWVLRERQRSSHLFVLCACRRTLSIVSVQIGGEHVQAGPRARSSCAGSAVCVWSRRERPRFPTPPPPLRPRFRF